MEGIVKVTTDDLLEALRAALSTTDDEHAHTLAELCEKFNCGDSVVRRHLHMLKKEGRLEVVRTRRPSLVGIMTSVPAYRIKSAP